MEIKEEIRYASHPGDAKNYDTTRIREEFLVKELFVKNEVNLTYSFEDRMIIGGLMPVENLLELKPMDIQKAEFFLQRREMGIINVGETGKIIADEQEYTLNYKDALYIGKGTKSIKFFSEEQDKPAKFYINSALAHTSFPSKKVPRKNANPVYLGDQEHSNKRVLNQYIVPGIVDTCQLMLGITKVYSGNVWNTMPCHLHPLRMEAYFYFEIDEGQAVMHLMGRPDETRHIWVHNEQAVISPSWSIHSASGTVNYSFIWGMSGSDSDMDGVSIQELM
jgi:4-deoxy-L-threo-5-hexosulose-uronate ketol-isomerase